MTNQIGAHTYGMPRFAYAGANVTIGKYCSIAVNVTIDIGGEHKTSAVSTFPFQVFFPEATRGVKPHTGLNKGDIVIGNDVWICEDVKIMSGVRIGDGVVLGTRAVVTRNIPPYAVAGGVPARVLKYRFPKKIIERLLKLRWWDWPDEKVKKFAPLLMTEDVKEFLRVAERENP